MAGAAGDPVATTFQAPAGQNIDNAKADALNNIAQNGAKGAAAMAATAQANAAARTQALQNAMAYTALRGAPAGNAAQGQATVAQPFDQRASVLGLMNANYAQNNQAMQQANTNYMEGMKAGLPIAQTALDRTISNNQSTNAAKRDAQNFQLAMKQAVDQAAIDAHNAARDLAQARLKATQDKAQTPAQIIASLGGADATADNLTGTALAMEQKQAQSNADQGAGTGPSGQGLGNYNDVSPTAVGAALGLPAGTVQSLLDSASAKDATQNSAEGRITPPSDAAVRSSDQYQSGSAKFQALISAAKTPAAKTAAINALITDVGPVVARVIINDYANQTKIANG